MAQDNRFVSIDSPKFVQAANLVEPLAPDETVLGLELDGVVRAYRHELSGRTGGRKRRISSRLA